MCMYMYMYIGLRRQIVVEVAGAGQALHELLRIDCTNNNHDNGNSNAYKACYNNINYHEHIIRMPLLLFKD